MKRKWYVEFLLVVALIAASVVFITNVDFSCKPKVASVSNNNAPARATPERERWLAGRDMFKANCVACHNIKYDGAGPALKGVTARWKAAGNFKGKTGEQWLKLWIHNWHDVVDGGYKYGIDMANSRPAQMNVFVGLSDKDIDDILFYVEAPDAGYAAAK